MACLLLDNSADVFAPRAKILGRTALEGATEHRRLDMIKLLWNATDGAGFHENECKIATAHANRQGHDHIMEYIQELVR